MSGAYDTTERAIRSAPDALRHRVAGEAVESKMSGEHVLHHLSRTTGVTQRGYSGVGSAVDVRTSVGMDARLQKYHRATEQLSEPYETIERAI